jgi:triosephosphate isomerase (TIM)
MKTDKPIVIVNFKTYKSGKDVLSVAKALEKVDRDVIVGLSASDLYLVSHETKLKVYCQHVDYFSPGRNTGFILPEAAKASGAVGVFLNHSEHRIDFDILSKTVKRCKEIGLKTIVFAGDVNEAKKMETLSPDFVVAEPPELVSSKDVSVSTAKPELISDVARALKSKFLVGAGVKDYNDLKISLDRGASGIILSSAIMTSENPAKVFKELIGK